MAAGILSQLRCRLVRRLARWLLGRLAAGGWRLAAGMLCGLPSWSLRRYGTVRYLPRWRRWEPRRLACRLRGRLRRWRLGRLRGWWTSRSMRWTAGWLRPSAVRWWTCRSRQGRLCRPGPRLPRRSLCGHRRRLVRRSTGSSVAWEDAKWAAGWAAGEGFPVGCLVGCAEGRSVGRSAVLQVVGRAGWKVALRGRKVPCSVGQTADGRVG